MRKSNAHERWGNLPAIEGKSALALRLIVAGAVLIFCLRAFHEKTLFVLLVISLYEIKCNELFKRCATIPADENAWHELFRRYLIDIRAAIYRVIGFPPKGRYCQLFDDVMQRFNLRLLENDRRALLAFKGQTEPEARQYLRRVASSVAINTLRSEPPHSMPLDVIGSSESKEAEHRGKVIPDPMSKNDEFILLCDSINNCLQRVLRGRNKFRNMLIFKLWFYDGFSYDEIAGIPSLKISSRHAVEEQISRIRHKVRRYLA